MLHYAEQIFDETFTPEALITEQRQSPVVFLAGSQMNNKGSGFPDWQNRNMLQPSFYKTPEEYLKAQAQIWFPGENAASLHDRIKLGRVLKEHVVFRAHIDLVTAIPRTEKDVLSELARHFEALEQSIWPVKIAVLKYRRLEFLSLLLFVNFALISTVHRTLQKQMGSTFLQRVAYKAGFGNCAAGCDRSKIPDSILR